jgi:single-strand DNA-binding protein
MNNVTMTGRLTKNPTLRYTAVKKTPVAEFRLAVNDFVAGQQRTDYFDVVQYGTRAEALAKHVAKGRLVGVAGKLRLDEWPDKNTGERRSRVRVEANEVDWLPQGTNGTTEPQVDTEPDDEPVNDADHDYPPRTDEDPGHVPSDDEPAVDEDGFTPGTEDEPF